ncbi:(2Fe-2S)-binding protein [Devosia yakushimensis]|uniref:(2Fe-2S)-binding protein n=1 Tax=Devosia yakushimensis TaxID=470028 RepID=UPI0024E18BA4|nr:(2Fe-2S)-binding protein [Devosia yakushimensis]
MFQKLRSVHSSPITIFIDGVPVPAESGESVAAVLVRQADVFARRTPVSQSKRAPYCMMGVCFECVAEIDGVASVQTCLKTVSDGMQVRRPTGKRRIAS